MSAKPYALWYWALFIAVFIAMLIVEAFEGEIKMQVGLVRFIAQTIDD